MVRRIGEVLVFEVLEGLKHLWEGVMEGFGERVSKGFAKVLSVEEIYVGIFRWGGDYQMGRKNMKIYVGIFMAWALGCLRGGCGAFGDGFLGSDGLQVRRLGEGFERSWNLGTVSGWRGSLRRVEYDDCRSGRVVELIDISNKIDTEGEHKRLRGLIRPVMASPPSGVDKWSLNYGLCVDACVNGSWCEGVVVDQEVGFDERLIFFPDSGNQKAARVEQLRITRDWNQGSGCWESRGNWLFLEALEGSGLGSLLGKVSLKQIWNNVRDREEYHKRLKDWNCKDGVFWDSLVHRVIRDMGLDSKQVTSDIDADRLRELTTKRRKTSDSQFLPGGGVLDEFDEEIQCIPPCEDQNLDVGSQDREGKEFFMVHGNNHGRGNDFMSVEEDVKEVDSQYDRTNGDCCSNNSTLSEPNDSQHDITSGDSSSDDSTCSASKRVGARKRGELQWQPTGDIIPRAKRIPEALVNYYVSYSKHGQPRKTKHTLQTKARMHLLYLGWRIEFTSKDKVTRFRYTSPDGETEYSLVQICERLIKPKRELWKKVIEKGHMNMANVPAELMNSSVFQQVVRRSLQSSEREVKNPSRVSPQHRKMQVSSVPTAEVLDVSGDDDPRFCPEAVILWNEIGSDREKRKQLKKIEKDTPDRAKNHLLAVGWKLWYKDKGTRQELRYTSPNGKTYISLVQACKACVEEGNLCMNTGLQNSIPDDKLKSLGNADKLSPPTSKCSEVNLCTNIGSQSDILDDEELKTLGIADKLSPPTTKCSEGDGNNLLPKNEQANESGLVSPGLPEPSLQSNVQEFQNSYPPHPPKPEQTQSKESVVSQINQEEAVAVDSNATNGFVEECIDSQHHKEEAVTADCNASSALVKEEGHQVNSGIRTSVLQSTKRTRQVLKPRQPKRKCILSILVDNNVVLLEDYVYYRGKTENNRWMAEGRITHQGIRCDCCQTIFGLSAFEVHAGSTNHRPAANIFLKDGRSLVDCQRQLDQAGGTKSSKTTSHETNKTNSNKMKTQSDQICSVCQYGGTLLLCENCPSAFHLNCIGLNDLPEGDWFCPSCRCGECGRGEFNGEIVHLNDKSVISCYQCERKYHIGCARLRGRMELERDGSLKESWFCSGECEQIFIGLHNILGKSIPLGVNELSWTILKPPKLGRSRNSLSVSGGLIRGHRRKLKLAVEVMHECFEPVNDPDSGSDIVQDVIFNRRSELNRLNFSGFYTMLLERENEIIAVATVRIYGNKVAEVPLVGTRFQYRLHGMCRVLFNALEKKLFELGVERLVLPAAKGVLKTWTGSFGFSEMTEAERLMFLEYTFMDFQVNMTALVVYSEMY
ncbi:hypothetical protein Sjap_014134 [Stephania japonica]|uniref:Uncharacterized protein n=1 Tax=Stephania japonica TaxID=461633 RepID=A0AAP0J198_9MAGN